MAPKRLRIRYRMDKVPTEQMTGLAQGELHGGKLLAEISRRMVGLFREYIGRGPTRCKSYWAGPDILLVVLGEDFTRAESELLDQGRGSDVMAHRAAMQDVLERAMRDEVERLTGRGVRAFISGSHHAPDLSTELFVLEPLGASSAGSQTLPG